MYNQKTRCIATSSIRMPSNTNAMTTKGNVVLYLDKELVEKSKDLGLNLSKTFEHHLKQLINRYSPASQNNTNSRESKSCLVSACYLRYFVNKKSSSLAKFGC